MWDHTALFLLRLAYFTQCSLPGSSELVFFTKKVTYVSGRFIAIDPGKVLDGTFDFMSLRNQVAEGETAALCFKKSRFSWAVRHPYHFLLVC